MEINDIKILSVEQFDSVSYDYDRLEKAKEDIKSIKYEQKHCSHDFSTDIKELPPIEYINNPNNLRLISVINSTVAAIIRPKYSRICKKCGKVEYFYCLDEAETCPKEGLKLFNRR